MNSVERICFNLEGINLIEFYGVGDSKINRIRAAYPEVKIVARGERFVLSGDKDKVMELSLLIESILKEIRNVGHLPNVRLVELLEQNPRNIKVKSRARYADEVVLKTYTGKVVRAKTEGQYQMVKAMDENDILFALGPAGTGKTYMAVALAVRALKNKRVKKIVLARPAVEAGENLGFLPGDMKEKVDPYLRPLYDAWEEMMPLQQVNYYIENNIIEILPLAFMRGRSLSSSFIILDEAQNATKLQLKMFLTRMGLHSKIIITGDPSQVDLVDKGSSGLMHAVSLLNGIKGIAYIELKRREVLRHPLVKEIISAYEGK